MNTHPANRRVLDRDHEALAFRVNSEWYVRSGETVRGPFTASEAWTLAGSHNESRIDAAFAARQRAKEGARQS